MPAPQTLQEEFGDTETGLHTRTMPPPEVQTWARLPSHLQNPQARLQASGTL